MTIKKEPMHAGEFLLSEGAGNISREAINVAAGPALYPGQVLGLVTASGEFAPSAPAANCRLCRTWSMRACSRLVASWT